MSAEEPARDFLQRRDLIRNKRLSRSNRGTLSTALSCATAALAAPLGERLCRVQVAELARDDLNGTIMCVGHNRGWQEAAAAFAATPVLLKTAHAALLQSAAPSWAAAVADGAPWRLVGLVTPDDGFVAAPES